MARLGKAVALLALLALVAGAAVGVAVHYDAECPTASAPSGDGETMEAIVYRCYGGPEVLALESISKPTPAEDEVLVRVQVAGFNPHDTHVMRGTPRIIRMESGIGAPRSSRLGTDFAGAVEAVGAKVTRFKSGDEVFGAAKGAFAEYVTMKEDGALVTIPANMTIEQAAATPIAALTALQALRDRGGVERGTKVLINGASGGVGTFAVQIAKSMGAEVTGVCSTRNVERVRELGADHVIDYTQADFTQGDLRYDVIIDAVVNHSLSEYRRVLTSEGTLVVIGAPDDTWLGPLKLPMQQKLLLPFSSKKVVLFMADYNARDLTLLKDLMEAGKLTPIIDRQYALSELPQAIEYSETGRARGKIIIQIGDRAAAAIQQ